MGTELNYTNEQKNLHSKCDVHELMKCGWYPASSSCHGRLRSVCSYGVWYLLLVFLARGRTLFVRKSKETRSAGFMGALRKCSLWLCNRGGGVGHANCLPGSSAESKPWSTRLFPSFGCEENTNALRGERVEPLALERIVRTMVERAGVPSVVICFSSGGGCKLQK